MNVDSFIRFENDVRAHGGHKWVGYADGGSIASERKKSAADASVSFSQHLMSGVKSYSSFGTKAQSCKHKRFTRVPI